MLSVTRALKLWSFMVRESMVLVTSDAWVLGFVPCAISTRWSVIHPVNLWFNNNRSDNNNPLEWLPIIVLLPMLISAISPLPYPPEALDVAKLSCLCVIKLLVKHPWLPPFLWWPSTNWWVSLLDHKVPQNLLFCGDGSGSALSCPRWHG